MKYLKHIIVTLIAIVCISSANAKTYNFKNCKQLNNPKAVLLVHATWCSYCKRFLPTYESVSNRADMKDYKFYTYLNNNSQPVCGVRIPNVPTTFSNNMKNREVGAISYNRLVNFVKSKG